MKYSPRWKEKGTLVYCCWEYKLVQLLRRTVWKFSLQRPRAAAELKADSFQGLDSYLAAIPCLCVGKLLDFSQPNPVMKYPVYIQPLTYTNVNVRAFPIPYSGLGGK